MQGDITEANEKMGTSGWPGEEAINCAEWDIFHKTVSESWVVYDGGDRLVELKTSIGNKLEEWAENDALFGKLTNMALDLDTKVVTDTLESLTWCVKTLKTFAKHAGSDSALKRYAKARKKAYHGLEDSIKDSVPKAIVQKLQSLQ